MVVNEFFDALESRDSAQREAALLAALPQQVAHAQARSEAFAMILDGVDPQGVRSRAAQSTVNRCQPPTPECSMGAALGPTRLATST